MLPLSSELLDWAKQNLDLKIATFTNHENAADFMSSNQAASIACADLLGVDLSAELLAKFPGMERRQSTLFESPTRTILGRLCTSSDRNWCVFGSKTQCPT